MRVKSRIKANRLARLADPPASRPGWSVLIATNEANVAKSGALARELQAASGGGGFSDVTVTPTGVEISRIQPHGGES